jgi:hypothetical protein
MKMRSWWRFLRRDEADAEQRRELEAYLEIATDENIARGMDPQAARELARRKLGNSTLIREDVRAMNTWTHIDALLRHIRITVRSLRRNPVFAVTAILTLVLGIGANTAVFSVVDGILLKPMPLS